MLALLAREWAYVTTYRLFLDGRADSAARSTAKQRFDLEDGRVVPQIVVHNERIAFEAAIGRPTKVRAEIRPEGSVSYEISIVDDAAEQRLCGGTVVRRTSVTCSFPRGIGLLSVTTTGTATWSDLRLERQMRVTPQLAVLTIVGIFMLMTRRRAALSRSSDAVAFAGCDVRSLSRPWTPVLLAGSSVVLSLVFAELTLRVIGTHISTGISAVRHDLGEPTNDPRWQQTPRYGQRLAANVDAVNEWRYGDIVRMGFLSPAVARGDIHRYRFHTDEEGFRNAHTRPNIAVAALGDSFTDAQTMSVEFSWPMQLERKIGQPVQNYGTAGFGPQQELLTLEEFTLPHHPRVVVLAFFGGNDIRDAEVFELKGRTDAAIDRPELGWPIKKIVTRADTWFVVNAFQAAATRVASASEFKPITKAVVERGFEPAGPTFDRGMFTVPVGTGTLRWAFMPPYLGWLTYSNRDLARRAGWRIADRSLVRMARLSAAAGAQLVVAFIPSKAQVYLPVLARSMDTTTLGRALQEVLQMPSPPDINRLLGNRLAANELVRDVCVREHIAFLDLTPVLQARVEAGYDMYFADDSHLNEDGEAAVADALARFLGPIINP
jgi:lysophospholipase L1-like esterase